MVNVETLEKLAADGKLAERRRHPRSAGEAGRGREGDAPVKVLGNGELKAKLDVSAHAFSKSAVEKIETAGGKSQTISSTPKE